MEKLTGSEKQIKWANDIIADIKKYTGKTITELKSSVIIEMGKGINALNADSCVEGIEGWAFALKNNLNGKEQGTLNDNDYDLMELAVENKEITMVAFNAIYYGIYKNIK